MRALIDGDVLRYEIGHSAQYFEEDEETGEKETIVREWDFCQELLDQKLFVIKEQTESDDITIFLTNDKITNKIYNRWAKTFGEPQIELKDNFRNDIATVKEYKASRKSEKPFHFENLTAYIMSEFDFQLANGVEADDLMAQAQTEDTIICSRDKDLRQVPGLHYSWECGNQTEIGPFKADKKGMIEDKGNGKVFGYGEMFFLYQLLVGDVVDNIPGCPKVGHVKAFKLLTNDMTRKQAYMAVYEAYRAVYEEDALAHLTEQARLLWLLRASDDVWEFPYEI